MVKHTTKANIITSALRVMALVILLAFVWNQSSKIFQNSDAPIEIVTDELDDQHELEDVLQVHSISLNPALSRVFEVSSTPSVNNDQLWVQHPLCELPSPPPEQA